MIGAQITTNKDNVTIATHMLLINTNSLASVQIAVSAGPTIASKIAQQEERNAKTVQSYFQCSAENLRNLNSKLHRPTKQTSIRLSKNVIEVMRKSQ